MWFVLFIGVPSAGFSVREPIAAARLPPWMIAPAFLLFVVAMLIWLPWFTTPYPAERKRMLLALRNSLKGVLTRPLQHVDPVFGPLKGEWVEYRGDRYICWLASALFTGHGEEAEIRIFSDDSGPTESQRELFVEFKQRYPELRKLIEEPLAREYESIRQSWQLDSPPLTSASEIWNVARLFAIEINQEDRRNSDLALDHSIDWDAGHELNVAITDWQVAEVMLEG